MHKSEELAKLKLIKKGYRVWRNGYKGMPDFQCWNKNERFYVEVKSGNHGLSILQLQTITKLLQQGEKVYLFYYKDDSFETYEITTSLKKIIDLESVPRKYTNKHSIKIECFCGKVIEGYTQKQVDHMLAQHKLAKHKEKKKQDQPGE